MKVRNLVRSLHGSIGLLMGLLFLIVSLTGTGIVFHEELDHAINQSLHTVAIQSVSVPFDDILAPAQKAHPELPVQYVRFPKQSDGTYTVTMTDKNGHRLETFVNPYTGAVLGERVWEYSLTGFLYTLHHELFLGNTGQIILIVVGIALLLMSITGVILWTGWRKLRSGFKIRWNAPLSILSFDLHQVLGTISQIFLAILSITGAIIVLLHLFPTLVLGNGDTQSPPPNQPPIALNQLLQKADTALPGGQIMAVSFDPNQPRKFIVTKHFPEQETGRFDLSTVELDRYSGEVLLANKVVKPNALFSVLIVIANLHFGTIAGLPSRVLYMFVGVVPLLLFITGVKMMAARKWDRAVKKELRDLEIAQTQNQDTEINL
ncbi:PepSY domain-containing protein [Tumidithrix helvetica PCC 7403]|uniref:PepSY-associated TM helix domain-containing protein n=1 Tax=Tumidithrix helvetica TaxID=3457545 RepID=UPI003CB82C6E